METGYNKKTKCYRVIAYTNRKAVPFMKKRTLLSLLLSLVMLAGIALPAAAEQAPAGKLYILHTNDMHGRAVADPQAGILGYAAIAQYKKDLEAQGHDVLLLDAGDATQGTPLVNLGMGKNAIEFMNAAGYMAMSPGNHEFDWGSDNLKQLAGFAKFPILSASILDAVSKEVTFKANTVFETKAGLKVGVFGLATPETATKAHPDKVRGVEFLQGEELFKAAQAQVDELKAAGAQLIVALVHLGVDPESAPNRATDVLENVKGIDLMIVWHSHTEFE